MSRVTRAAEHLSVDEFDQQSKQATYHWHRRRRAEPGPHDLTHPAACPYRDDESVSDPGCGGVRRLLPL